jgi:hypothetical protein
MASPARDQWGLSVIAETLLTMIRETEIERLLERQHGAVSRARLRKAGVSMNTVNAWIRPGRLGSWRHWHPARHPHPNACCSSVCDQPD